MTERELEQGLDERLAEQEEADERWAREEAPAVLPAHIDRRFVMQREGKDYVLYAGLLDMLHQMSGGNFAVDTEVLQFPQDSNSKLAVVKATVRIYDEGRIVRSCTGIGDASAESVNRMMAPHIVRMAETRAVARALRVLTNIGMTALEELGPSGPAPSQGQGQSPQRNGAPEPEGIVVQGKRFTRSQVWNAYTQRMEQMKAAGLAVPAGMVFTQASPLSQLVGATQNMRRQLEAAHGGEPPAPERSN